LCSNPLATFQSTIHPQLLYGLNPQCHSTNFKSSSPCSHNQPDHSAQNGPLNSKNPCDPIHLQPPFKTRSLRNFCTASILNVECTRVSPLPLPASITSPSLNAFGAVAISKSENQQNWAKVVNAMLYIDCIGENIYEHNPLLHRSTDSRRFTRPPSKICKPKPPTGHPKLSSLHKTNIV
jgi:hypothetical protein